MRRTLVLFPRSRLIKFAGFAVGLAIFYLLLSTNGLRGFQPTECVSSHLDEVTSPADAARGGDTRLVEVCDHRVKTGKKHWFKPFG
jgi:hypothetical protein